MIRTRRVILASVISLCGATCARAHGGGGGSDVSVAADAAETPTLFARGVLSTADMELNSAFTPDGQTVYFTKRTPKPQLWVILESHAVRGGWTTPQVASFSGRYSDFDPFLSPDGSKLFFSSIRPVSGEAKGDFDLWMVERTLNGWGDPKHLDAPINTSSAEYYSSVAADGTLYFASNRPGGKGGLDIYRARSVNGGYAPPVNLGDSINSPQSDGDPYIAPDQSYIIFVSYGRPDGFGDGDLYISRRLANGEWTKAANLGPRVNSSALDFCPIVSPDRRFLYFTSERGFADKPVNERLDYASLLDRLHSPGNGLGDIYRVALRQVLGLSSP